jgi:hypothetical protein
MPFSSMHVIELGLELITIDQGAGVKNNGGEMLESIFVVLVPEFPFQ